ncbi:hypothetical protein ACWGJ2_13590 [Streptomyces sp. NPDC054796]
MANSINRSHGETQTQERNGIDLERGPAAPVTGDEEQPDASADKSSRWDIPKKFTLTGTMTSVSYGYARDKRIWKAIGFGLLSAHSAEKAAESWPKDPESAATSVVNTLGTAVWSAGIGTGNRIAQTVGPAINFTANITSAALRYHQGKEGWGRELIDAAEMAAFTGAGYTEHPVARTLAFGSASLGFFVDATKDKALVAHGIGAGAWAVGAALKSDTVQAVGAGVVAAAEAARLAYPLYEKYAQKPASEAAPQQPGVELAPLQSSAVQNSAVQSSAPTPEPPARAAAHLPPPPGAAASNSVAPSAPTPVTSAVPSPVTSAASTPFVSAQSTPIPSRAPSPVAPEAPSPTASAASTPYVSAQSTPIPSRAPSPVTSEARSSIASRYAPPTPESRPQSVPGDTSSRPSTPRAWTPVPAQAAAMRSR